MNSGSAFTPAFSSSLLPANALSGQRVGISVSDSADLRRLGLLSSHFNLALRELARIVLVGGGTLAYGGHLVPGGYTEFLIGELHRYAQAGLFNAGHRGPALLVCLAWQEHRHRSLEELNATNSQLGVYGEMRCLDLDGRVIVGWSANRLTEGEPYPSDKAVLAQGLSALRTYMTGQTSARLLLGGKRQGYTGPMPGVLQEALLALRAAQPLYLASGLGGVTLDITGAIDGRCAGLCPRHGSDPPLDQSAMAGLDELRALISSDGWRRLNNGLDEAENLQLSMTHRPAEIAALVALGLGRWAQSRAAQQGHGR
ncbi:hypothetical protein QTH90_21065 [Variovorax sp. J2P1-59]|uniref:hypothetical protein n=1 Tax=Variovorax flavidus TaxID=3053501 RepID=UPI00257633BF|nr:hypothetical protein [Variovorax sp. J2P1-59]MDM0076913.1 hypothetical protein [Variovorax sp. J2P1-59]